ncbi:hypothetical protein OG588_42160 [Streptomyces prunicolor]|uniref:hypothetical protein n=1 Tax=Streptomyces prunicolor TaxID=67348 RepID=UPI003869CBC8|nr:hypothetical protein OG588_42160 [Streptomyces prunicolor]
MMPAATGIIFVLMKKNSTSSVLRTGRTDRACAAGEAGSSTRTVVAAATTIELPAYAQKVCLERVSRTPWREPGRWPGSRAVRCPLRRAGV